MTNKYAEGYPGKRYYGGCQHVDTVETLAIERAKQIFGAEHVNVQPHSGSQANMAAYLAVLKPGDTILGIGPGPRWTLDSRQQGEFLRHDLSCVFLWRRSPDRNHRLCRGPEDCRRMPSTHVGGRSQRLRPHPRLPSSSKRSPSRSEPICWSTSRILPD